MKCMKMRKRWFRTLKYIQIYKYKKRPTHRNENESIANLDQWNGSQHKYSKLISQRTRIRTKWYNYLSLIKKYIDVNNMRPHNSSTIKEIKRLYNLISNQQNHYYKTNTNIMKDPEIYNTWTEFIQDPKYELIS